MRATTGSGRRLIGPRLAVLGCVLVVAAGCSGSSDAAAPAVTTQPGAAATAPATPTAPTASSAPTPSAGTVVEISVTGNRVTPKPGRRTVKAGQSVRLVLTTDKANVVHVHGADVERDVKAGVPLTLDFTVDEPGVYPIELHEPELLLTQIVVR